MGEKHRERERERQRGEGVVSSEGAFAMFCDVHGRQVTHNCFVLGRVLVLHDCHHREALIFNLLTRLHLSQYVFPAS